MQKSSFYRECNGVAQGRVGGVGRKTEQAIQHQVFIVTSTLMHDLYSLSGKQFKTFH